MSSMIVISTLSLPFVYCLSSLLPSIILLLIVSSSYRAVFISCADPAGLLWDGRKNTLYHQVWDGALKPLEKTRHGKNLYHFTILGDDECEYLLNINKLKPVFTKVRSQMSGQKPTGVGCPTNHYNVFFYQFCFILLWEMPRLLFRSSVRTQMNSDFGISNKVMGLTALAMTKSTGPGRMGRNYLEHARTRQNPPFLKVGKEDRYHYRHEGTAGTLHLQRIN